MSEWTKEKIERYALRVFGELIRGTAPPSKGGGAYAARLHEHRGGTLLSLGTTEAEARMYARLTVAIAALDTHTVRVERMSGAEVLALRDERFGAGCSCGVCSLEALR